MSRLQKLGDQEYTPFMRVLFGQASPTPLPSDLNDPSNPLHKLEWNDPGLNDSQKEAIKFALASREVALIHGPPGTGKTHTIIIILCQLLRQLPKSRFLVTAPTHNAVDNILRRFVNTKSAKEAGTTAVRVSTQVSRVMNFIISLAHPLTCSTPAVKSIARPPAIYLRRNARPRPHGQCSCTPKSPEANQRGPYGLHHMYWREPWAIA